MHRSLLQRELGYRSAGWLTVWVQFVVHCSPRWDHRQLFAGWNVYFCFTAGRHL